jgi:hypothetical protein
VKKRGRVEEYKEKWLNSLAETMTPFWDCQWKFRSTAACDEFIAYLLSSQGDIP